MRFRSRFNSYSEEHALLADLGDDYRRHAATRRRLFPGLW